MTLCVLDIYLGLTKKNVSISKQQWHCLHFLVKLGFVGSLLSMSLCRGCKHAHIVTHMPASESNATNNISPTLLLSW
jgi:hypothetical protein